MQTAAILRHRAAQPTRLCVRNASPQTQSRITRFMIASSAFLNEAILVSSPATRFRGIWSRRCRSQDVRTARSAGGQRRRKLLLGRNDRGGDRTHDLRIKRADSGASERWRAQDYAGFRGSSADPRQPALMGAATTIVTAEAEGDGPTDSYFSSSTSITTTNYSARLYSGGLAVSPDLHPVNPDTLDT